MSLVKHAKGEHKEGVFLVYGLQTVITTFIDVNDVFAVRTLWQILSPVIAPVSV
jgi:hypothetical protein